MNAADSESWFNLGTEDLRATVKGLKAGRRVPVELRLSNASFLTKGAPFRTRGGIRLGAVRIVDPKEAIAEAAKLAEKSDGELAPPSSNASESCSQHLLVAIVIVGLNHELESEGFDRPDMRCVGLYKLMHSS